MPKDGDKKSLSPFSLRRLLLPNPLTRISPSPPFYPSPQTLTSILGDTLYMPKDGEKEFPSPFSLRGKILISTQPPKGPKELSTVVATDDPAEEKTDGKPADGAAGGAGGAGGEGGVATVASEERRAKAKVLGLGDAEKGR
ncbi:unnamed protein product [Closterium sp. NIES-54]